MIQIRKETKLDFAPREPEDAEWGLGFTPFIINLGLSDAPPPTISDIRQAAEEFFNNSCKAKFNTKFSTWTASAALGSWEPTDPTYLWPKPGSRASGIEEEEEG